MSDDPRDVLAKMRADLDQAIASFPQTANLLRGHYSAHVAAGFTDTQAMTLTLGFQSWMLNGDHGAE